jgi:hypothetical protein
MIEAADSDCLSRRPRSDSSETNECCKSRVDYATVQDSLNRDATEVSDGSGASRRQLVLTRLDAVRGVQG